MTLPLNNNKLFQVQSTCIVGIKLCKSVTFLVVFFKIFAIVRTTIVRQYTIEVVHIYNLRALFIDKQNLSYCSRVSWT